MAKIRNPESETPKKPEIRNPKHGGLGNASGYAFRISDFGLLSGFGFRFSVFCQFLAVLSCSSTVLAAATDDVYLLGPDSRPHEGVPKGKVIGPLQLAS
jgi:hypothetical protein